MTLDLPEPPSTGRRGTVVLLRYRSMYDWQAAPEAEAFHSFYAETDARAAELTQQGQTVCGVLFERAPYRHWLAGRGDTPELREDWARVQAASRAPGVWTFTLGDPPAIELIARAAQLRLGPQAARFGWWRE